MITSVKIVAAYTAVASLLLGQSVIQVSGTQVVGVAISVVGFMLAGLISLVAWLLTNKLNAVVATQTKHTDSLAAQDVKLAKIDGKVEVLDAWMEERKAAHEQANREQVKRLREEIARKKSGG